MAGALPEMLHSLNAHHSKTSLLPLELISIIFQHACPTPDVFIQEPTPPPPFQLTLRLVSTLWYYIVQTTPQLWASVILPKLCAENFDTKGRFLKLCLDHSGCLPLTLSFRFDPGLGEVNGLISPIVDTILEHNTHRIQALRLFRPPRSWLEYLIPKMCQLARIYIDNPRFNLPRLPPNTKRYEDLFLPEATNLSRIYVSYPHLSSLRFACVTTSITHVELYKFPIDFAMEILLRCPNLIDFGFLCPLVASKVINPRTMLASPLVLNHLSTFTWPTNHGLDGISEWDIVLFEHVHFPSLKRFSWWPDERLPVENTTLALSLSRFSESLTTLELAELDVYSPEEYFRMEMFLPLTGVIQLRFLRCGRDFVEQAFSVLSHKTDGSNTLFPKLKSIVIDCRDIERDIPPWAVFGPESGEKLVQMLRSRIGLMDEFTLTAEIAPLTQDWDDGVWRILRELKRDGLDLTIIDCGRPIIL